MSLGIPGEIEAALLMELQQAVLLCGCTGREKTTVSLPAPRESGNFSEFEARANQAVKECC